MVKSYAIASHPLATAASSAFESGIDIRGVVDARVQKRQEARQRARLEDPDADLVEAWQAGDEDAFEKLVKLHEGRVFRLLLRMMGSREEAEDLTQETFLRLHTRAQSFRRESRFSTFVYRVAANAALSRRRALGRARTRIERLATRQAAGDDLPWSSRCPEDATAGAETTVRVREALARLTPTLRLPIVMYDIEGMAYAEIAESLGVAVGTVKSRIHRARCALRSDLAEALDSITPNDDVEEEESYDHAC